MSKRTALVAMAALLLAASAAQAEVKVSGIFGSNMVLQRDATLPVWGKADAGENVTVTLLADDKEVQSAKAVADADGKWTVKLTPIKTGPVYALVIKGSNEIKLTNILAGEVWLCSGQSNMAWTFNAGHTVANNNRELAAADYPQIRLLTVPKKRVSYPVDSIQASWAPCSRESLAAGKTNGFSALAYFFGRELHQKLEVPVGLINSSFGGTQIELWMPGGNLYNPMIYPLAPLAIRGAIWYQGESNCMTRDGMKYADKTKVMLEGWRKLWGQGDFPFYFVQIAPYTYSGKKITAEELPIFWEAQTTCLDIPNTGMVVCTDVVTDLRNIHPTNKQDVGKRLALWALARTYGCKDLEYSGPAFKSMKAQDGKIRLTFDHLGGGLVSRDGAPLNWFVIAGEDKRFVKAQAAIDGDSVVVSSPDVPNPKAVRLGWDERAQPNLMNKAGLPAWPFRTDRWTEATMPTTAPATQP